MKIINEKPLFLPLIKPFFKAFDWENNIIAFGKRIYVKRPMSMYVEAHEIVHLQQQKESYMFAILWWIWYIISKKFRFNQELEAYRTQWRIYRANEQDRNKQVKYMDFLSSCLCSPLYGKLISKAEAEKLIDN